MNDLLTLKDLYNSVHNNKIDKEEASKILESLINESDDEKVRTKAIEIIGALFIENERIFNLLEKSLVSDVSPLVRFAAANTLILNFPDKVKEPLKWAIENEKSIYFFKNFIDFLEEHKDLPLEDIKSLTLETVEKYYKLNYLDLRFILDIDYVDYLRFKKDFRNFVNKFNVKEDHENEIIKENTDIGYKGLGRVKTAKDGFITGLNLTDLDIIPESISLLSKLESLEITRCKLDKLPIKGPNISNLKRFVLSNNKLGSIPGWVYDIANMEFFVGKYWDKGVLRSEAPVLALLEFLTGKEMNKLETSEELPKNNAQYYKINTTGNITKISINYSQYPQIGIFPKYLSKLEKIEELSLVNQNIKELPNFVGQLKSLIILDLKYNKIEIIPDSLHHLINLEYLDLRNNEGENYIIQIPKSIKKLTNLKVLDLRGNIIKNLPKSIERLKVLKI